MEYINLGTTGCKVSRLCLGTMMFGGKTDRDESIRIVRAAIDAGVNFIDTANVYAETRSESYVGEALQGVRDQVVLATKVGMKMGDKPNESGISRYHYVRAVEASLTRLKTDRIDIYYVHWPWSRMNIEEMMRALDDLVTAGKIVYPACSNFPAWLVMKSQWVADVNKFAPFVCGQYPYSLIERGIEVEILPMAENLKFGINVYRPIAIGVLTGRYLDVVPDDSRAQIDARVNKWMDKYGDAVRKLADFATARGFNATAAANAWCLSHPAVTSVILGISKLSQLQDNLHGFDLKLSPEDRIALSEIFGTEIKEEAGGSFPAWRRRSDIL